MEPILLRADRAGERADQLLARLDGLVERTPSRFFSSLISSLEHCSKISPCHCLASSSPVGIPEVLEAPAPRMKQ